ncbi:MAG: HD domain-containing protein [Desulfuromonadaceae bacterium]
MEIPEGYDRLTSLAETAKGMYDRAGLKRHNWDHISRNFNRAAMILEQERADVEVTLAGVILHDIGYFYGCLKDHAHVGAERCEDILVEHGFAPEEIAAVRHCIVAHDPASGVLPLTMEAKIVYDADMLDKSDIALLLSGSLYDVAEEFGVTVTHHAGSFVKRFEPLLKEGRAYFTESGKKWDNGNLAAIIELARRLR